MSKTVINIISNSENQLQILEFIGGIMAKIDGLAARLNEINTRLGKIGVEVVTAVDALRTTIEAKGDVPSDVEAALASLEASVTSLDDLNADAVVQDPVVQDPVV